MPATSESVVGDGVECSLMAEHLKSLEDERLVELCQESAEPLERREMLDELIRRHQRRVVLWCLRLCRNPDDASDLAQEIFLQVTQRIDSFQGRSRFSTWLYSVVRNHCFNHARRTRSQTETIEADQLQQVVDPEGERWLETLEAESSHQRLLELMNRTLSSTERQIMVLHYGQEIPLAPLTRLLQLDNPSGAKAFIVSAKRKLTAALRRERARQDRGPFPEPAAPGDY